MSEIILAWGRLVCAGWNDCCRSVQIPKLCVTCNFKLAQLSATETLVRKIRFVEVFSAARENRCQVVSDILLICRSGTLERSTMIDLNSPCCSKISAALNACSARFSFLCRLAHRTHSTRDRSISAVSADIRSNQPFASTSAQYCIDL